MMFALKSQTAKGSKSRSPVAGRCYGGRSSREGCKIAVSSMFEFKHGAIYSNSMSYMMGWVVDGCCLQPPIPRVTCYRQALLPWWLVATVHVLGGSFRCRLGPTVPTPYHYLWSIGCILLLCRPVESKRLAKPAVRSQCHWLWPIESLKNPELVHRPENDLLVRAFSTLIHNISY